VRVIPPPLHRGFPPQHAAFMLHTVAEMERFVLTISMVQHRSAIMQGNGIFPLWSPQPIPFTTQDLEGFKNGGPPFSERPVPLFSSRTFLTLSLFLTRASTRLMLSP